MDKFLDRWAGRPSPVPVWVRDHLTNCPACSRLFELLGPSPPAGSLPLRIQFKIEERLLPSLRPVSPMLPFHKLTLACLLAFGLPVLFGIRVAGVAALEAMTVLQFTVVASVLAAGTVLLAISVAWQMAPASYQRISPQGVLVAVVTAYLMAFALLFPWTAEPDFLASGVQCGRSGLLFAILTASSVWLLARRGEILSPGLAGATIGMLAGLGGAVTLHFGCPNLAASHLVVWHAGIPIVSAYGGFLVGKVLGARRSERN